LQVKIEFSKALNSCLKQSSNILSKNIASNHLLEIKIKPSAFIRTLKNSSSVVKVSKLFAYTHNHNPKNQHACEAKPPTPQPNSKQKTTQNQKAQIYTVPKK